MSHSVIVYDLTTGEIFYSNTEHLLYLLFGFLAFSRLEKGALQILWPFQEFCNTLYEACLKVETKKKEVVKFVY